MADQRDGGIAWCDETWNPIRGCSRVSPGCEHCYAERTAARFSGPGQPYEGIARRKGSGTSLASISKEGRWTGQVRLVPEHLGDPLRWRRPRRIFVNSMSDLFHERLLNSEIDAVFAVMALAPQHTFQVLTKRPARMLDYFSACSASNVWARIEVSARQQYKAHTGKQIAGKTLIGPLPNVWLGVTAEDQQRADERIPLLLQTPAAVRFVSVEPQLGPVNLSEWIERIDHCGSCGEEHGACEPDRCPACGAENSLISTWGLAQARGYRMGTRDPGRDGEDGSQLHWVICGAESGPGARPFDLAWARSLRDQCAAAGVAYFFKQAIVDGKKVSTPPLDGVVHAEFPR